MHLERTAIYVLCSGVVALAGLVIMFADGKGPVGLSIGTSLIAGGLTSIGFSVIRYFDDNDADSAKKALAESLSSLRDTVTDHTRSIDSFRRVTAAFGQNDDHRIFNRNPKEEIIAELNGVHEHVEIDVAALTGMPFRQDLLEILLKQNVSLRLLVQDPSAGSFESACQQEALDVRTMMEHSILVTRTILKLQENGQLPGRPGLQAVLNFNAQIRWFAGYPSITLTRVGQVMYARPRFLREGASGTRTFFERYIHEDGPPYDAYRAYFDMAWESSRAPSHSDCESVSAILAKLPGR